MLNMNMENHRIKFKLKEVMEDRNMSKNKVCVLTGLRFETVQGYYKGNISRVDLYVLSLLCECLNCQVGDILEYKKPEDEKESQKN